MEEVAGSRGGKRIVEQAAGSRLKAGMTHKSEAGMTHEETAEMTQQSAFGRTHE
jgi:hypothetical protein